MLSKGQGNTMGTYEQLIQALDMDSRADEAHEFWKNKIGSDLHSVPWSLCKLMISVYYRNNMLEDLIKVCIFLNSKFYALQKVLTWLTIEKKVRTSKKFVTVTD